MTKLSKSLKVFVVVAFAASSIACGDIQMPQTLALVGDENVINMAINPDSPDPIAFAMGLEGGVDTTITISLSLADLIFQHGLNGVITVDYLLFGATPFAIFGIPTDEVCIVRDDMDPGGGSVFINIFQGLMSFDALFNTRVKLGNPTLANAIPDGFPFPMAVSDVSELSIADMLGMIFGNADGGMAISQTISDQFEAEILPGVVVPIGVEASLTLGTVNEFPSGQLIDDCLAIL
jgi:hypothetical protein